MQNLVDVGRREGGLRRDGIFRYFLCSISILAHAYRSHQKTDHDRLWLKTRVSAWARDIYEIFESQYLEKYALAQHKIWKGISGAQIDFVGGPALQNYNSRSRRPPS